MQVSLTQEEKREIHQANMCTWELFNKIPLQYIDFFDWNFIYDGMIICTDESIDTIMNLKPEITYDEFDEITTPSDDDSFDYVVHCDELMDLAKMFNDLVSEKEYDLRESVRGHINFCAFEYIQKHIVNELKKTDIPKVLQRVIVEYVFC